MQDHDALPGPVDTLEIPTTSVRESVIEARARLCFRALAICLAAIVLIFVSMSLRIVTSAFVDASRISPVPPHAMPAHFAETTEPAAVPADALPAPEGWTHAIVAVISVLLIGDVILTIGLIRATFSMRPDVDPSMHSERGKSPDAISLPGVELLKAVTDAFATVLKGLPKR
jgi:hypothetical protein